MKLIHTLVATALAALVFSSAAQAMPLGRGGVYYPTLTKKSDFENVKPGEKLVLVCKNSDSIKVTDFKDNGVPPKFDPIVMRGFVLVSGWFRCLAERRP